MKYLRVAKKLALLVSAIGLFALSQSNRHLVPLALHGYSWEKYKPELQERVSDIPSLLAYVDGKADTERHTLQYFNVLSQTIRKRFYHGYSHYSLSENWIAALAGKYLWDDLSAIVDPKDILRYPMAACSQQAIVMAASCRELGIPYRPVFFKHHFALEVNIRGQWYYTDPNMEPRYPGGQRASLAAFIRRGQLPVLYAHVIPSSQINEILGAPRYGQVNEPLAGNAQWFHTVTRFFSRWLWLWPALALIGMIHQTFLSVSLRHLVFPLHTLRDLLLKLWHRHEA